MKRLILSTVCILLCATGSLAQILIDGIYYNLDESTQTASVTRQSSGSCSGDITIPSMVTYGGTTYSVTSIEDYAFRSCSSLTSVTIPNSVTSIGHDAFRGCEALTSIEIPNSVTNIGSYAFDNCRNLISITIPSGVNSIESYAFRDCSGLTSIEIPNSVTNIGSYAFCNCDGLTNITIPNSVTSIGSYAFRGCSNIETASINSQTVLSAITFTDKLTSITLGDNITSIETSAFKGCSGLTSVTIPNSVTSIGRNAFDGCKKLTSVTIPNSVTSIGIAAFDGCSGLTSVTIPNSVTSIGNSAFYGCSGLKEVINKSELDIEKGTTANGYVAYYADYVCNGGKTIIGDFIFSNQDKTLVKYTGDGGSITLPENFNGDNYTVGKNAFSGNSSLASVTIPNSVTNIESTTFEGCSGLTSINVVLGNSVYDSRDNCNAIIETESNTLITGCKNTIIPSSVTSIGEKAFYNCSGLTSVTIPNSVTSIGSSAFSGCNKLLFNTYDNAKYLGNNSNPYLYLYCSVSQSITSCEINENCKIIADHAFNNCSVLASITIPSDVTSIGDGAFYDCDVLTSVTIPNSVTSIGEKAFYNCKGLKKTEFASVENLCKMSFGNFEANPLYYSHHLYINDKEITELIIPNSVTSIKGNVFHGCSGLTSVTIPNSVTNIEEKAFKMCDGLTSVTIGEGVTSIGYEAFYDCRGLTSVTIPNSVTSIGERAFYNVNHIVYTGSATGRPWGAILINGFVDGDFVFSDDTKTRLEAYIGKGGDVTIPNSVTSIGSSAFYDCDGLTSVTIPNSVTSIGERAFYNCTGLTSVTIPNSVTSIGYSAFLGCNNIEAADINSQAALDAINFTSKLVNIKLGDKITSIGDYAFRDCTGLTSVEIPNSVTSIGNYAFYQCTGLTSVEIPNGVTSIGDEAFWGCTGLTSVTIPNSVTSIGNYAFYQCSGLTSVTIPNSVTSIGQWAFSGCSGLTSITIPNSVTSIGYSAFRDCTGLTSVEIPNGVTSIGSYAFSGCSGLTSIIVPCEKYDYFIGAITQHAAIIYGDCSFEIAANENNEDYGTVTGNGVYNYAKNITLTATPNEHYHFVRWSDGSTENPRAVKVTQDSIFTAVFAIDEHNVTASPNSATGTVIGEGVYGYGTNITLTAMPNDHYHFVKWNDGDTENPRTVKVIQDSAFTAVFAIDEHNVIVSKNISAAGAVTGEGVYEYGTNITLTAMPNNEHYHFVKWNDGNTDNPRTIQVTQDSTFTALFTIDKYNVTISKNLSAAGTVTGDGVYEYGTNITLTATPNEGYRFKGWSDGAIGKSRELTVTKDIDLIANFVPLYTLKTLASASQGSVSGGGIYEDGEIATLVANAKPGYVFAQWADGNDENPRYVTVDGNKTYTAYFIEGEQDKYMITWKNWDGRVIKTSEVSYGEVPVFNGEKPTRPDEAGYKFTFNGWSPTIAAASQNAEYTANYIQTATEAEKTTIGDEGTVNITTTDNTALFTWPENASADTYTLTITRNDEVFCSLTFDGQGRLINLNFPNLRASAEGYQFTVTGLNSGTDYAYDLKAKNGAATVSEYTGEFRTSGGVATAAPEAEESIVETARYDINGRPLTAPTKGVNIVKYSDGSFEKEFVK